ncbi:hypothetical protein KGQ20_23795 [Catenulispora sp. NF23]|uniref:Uncharacterized protein n=1 Tax=Catenulispora pinistramenti TaxID=2705254 RepID=A0ABS5L1Q8_9ACTN|nr:hypothetical protein [Catenulispora pinistramenti]MBS2535790.1 hypothetical protein [Catenulispora pinistramenti]MBS2552273.1 hypothetical protein [Catenulispora pinistramenti]
MLTTLRRRVPAVAAVLALIASLAIATTMTAPKARAADCTWEPGPRGSTICVIQGQTPGGKDPGKKGTGVDINCDAAGNIVYNGTTYRCALGIWSFSGGCYITAVVPQPPTNDPIWGTDDPATHRLQWEDCTHIPPTLVGAIKIVGPCDGYCGGDDPVVRITKELEIAKPDLGMAPPGGPGATGMVNENVWLWSNGLDTSTQIRRAANVVGTRTFVSADWVVTRTTPSSGTIATLHCTSDNEYTAADGSAPSPDPACGFQFTAPGTYTVTVTTSWTLVITQDGTQSTTQNVTSTPNTTNITINEGESTNG